MELKEKLFNAIFDNAFEFKTENVVPECEQIADEYAIEFGKWLNNQVISSSGRHHNLLGVTKVTQLLPIFKKENGWTI